MELTIGDNMKKLVYFLERGKASNEDINKKDQLTAEGWKVFFSNGTLKSGFKDSCQAVYLSGEFPHIEEWAEGAGIEVMKPESEPEPKQAEEQKPRKPRAPRKPKAE